MSKRLLPSFSFFQFFIEFDAVASQEQQEPDPSMNTRRLLEVKQRQKQEAMHSKDTQRLVTEIEC